MNIKSFSAWYNSVKESDTQVAVSQPTSAIINDVDTIINSLETLASELTEELSEIEDEEQLEEGAGDFIKDWVASMKAGAAQKKVNKIKMNATDLRFAADQAKGDKATALDKKATAAADQAAELQTMVDDKFNGKGPMTSAKLSKTKIAGQMEIIKRTTGMEDDPKKKADLKTKMQELQKKAQEEDAAMKELEDKNADAIDAEKEKRAKEAEEKKKKEEADAAAAADNNTDGEPKGAEAKGAEAKDGEAKGAEAKDGESKDAESKDGESKGSEAKDGEAKDGESKDGEPKDAEAKDAEPKDAEPKDAEAKDAEPKDAEPKDAESKDAEPKDTEPKDAEPKDTEPKDAEPKDTEPKDAEPKDAETDTDDETEKKDPKESLIIRAKATGLNELAADIESKLEWQVAEGTILAANYDAIIKKSESDKILNESKYQIDSVKDAFRRLM
jgi:hypothetical protein